MEPIEQRWSIDGVHARWTLTVTIAPPDDDADAAPPECDFATLADHFSDKVNCRELGIDMERSERSSCWGAR